MGLVYRNSLVTIGFADATNSNGGCFSNGSSISAIGSRVTLPYQKDGQAKGFFYLSTKDEESISYGDSPLFSRGWVTQEWVLSRRTVLFFNNAVVRAGREVSEDE